MIIKSKSSEIFDEYSKNMDRYLKKRASTWSKAIELALGAGTGAAKSLDELLLGAGKTADDFIKEMSLAGKTNEEIARMTGKNADEIAGVLSDTGASSAKIIPEVASKATPELVDALNKTVKTLRSEILHLDGQIKNLKTMSLEGKAPAIIAQEVKKLEASRNAFKELLEQAKAESLTNASTAAQYSDDLKRLEAFLAKNIEQTAKLEADLLKSTTKLEEVSDALTVAQKTISKMEAEGVQLAAENKKLLEISMDKARESKKFKDLYEAELKASGDTSSAKAAKAASEAAAKESEEAASTVIKSNPNAAKSINEGLQQSAKKGSDDAAKIVSESANKPSVPSPTPKPGLDSSKPGARTFLQDFILKTVPGALAGSGAKALSLGGTAFKGISFLALASLLAVGGVIAYSYFFSDNEELIKKAVSDLKRSQTDSFTRLQALKFKPGSNGEIKTKDLISKITESYRSLPFLLNPETLTQQQLDKAMNDLSNIEIAITDYLSDKASIAMDLLDTEGWDAAIASLQALLGSTAAIKQILIDAYKSFKDNHPDTTSPSDRAPIGSPSREGQPGLGGTSNAVAKEPLTIFGKQFETSHLDPDMKDSLVGMLTSVIASPEGLAYLDPKGGRGPHGMDFLEAIKYLYKSGVGSPHEITKLFDRTVGRKLKDKNLRNKKNSAYHQRRKDYRNEMPKWRAQLRQDARKYLNREIKSENSEKFTQNFNKPANSTSSSVIYDDKRNDFSMQKKADQFSKQYFQDAIQGLEDQYAKSYYAGLKSMYDQKLGRTEADFNKMYQVHKETGADLIGEAHPKSINLADSMGNGGLVENQIEQQRHNKGVALSMPSGNFRGRHASVIRSLVKLANEADERGMKEASDLIDVALSELMS